MQNLIITLEGWKKILKDNGVSYFISTHAENFIFVNLKKEEKSYVVKIGRAEIIKNLKESGRDSELLSNHLEQMVAARALKMAIQTYLEEHKLYIFSPLNIVDNELIEINNTIGKG